MKGKLLGAGLLMAFGVSAIAQDIVFTNRTMTFTNNQGALFKDVNLVKADMDGLIWRDGVSGGRVLYTNLNPALLTSLGIPVERIEQAKARAQQKAQAEAKRRAQLALQLQTEAAAAKNLEQETVSADWSINPKNGHIVGVVTNRRAKRVRAEMVFSYSYIQEFVRHGSWESPVITELEPLQPFEKRSFDESTIGEVTHISLVKATWRGDANNDLEYHPIVVNKDSESVEKYKVNQE